MKSSGQGEVSARAAKITRPTVLNWRKADPQFAAAEQEARLLAGEFLEAEAVRRATQAKHPSDTLLIFLLKGIFPERYRETRTITGPTGGPMQLEHKIDLSLIPIEELEVIERVKRRCMEQQQRQISAAPVIEAVAEPVKDAEENEGWKF